MALMLTRNGAKPKSDVERLAAIRERINTELGRSQEEAPIYVEQFRQRVRKYERRYEMSSDTMMEALRAGKVRETRDILLWAWTWQILNRVKGASFR